MLIPRPLNPDQADKVAATRIVELLESQHQETLAVLESLKNIFETFKEQHNHHPPQKLNSLKRLWYRHGRKNSSSQDTAALSVPAQALLQTLAKEALSPKTLKLVLGVAKALEMDKWAAKMK
ncbi:Hypothetical protein R9X50_00405900 [Acrodontium crateriforme]|uniref:Uncharacterized protein n=1 Tax=Acrodontium crateriforme TaxID=150365 RepID=A0AAQ3M6V9_9PEZI|nr:Hypothetical protein R9X50_00405900 [Acrodontium crateriforme]